jgi:hypothetical protein
MKTAIQIVIEILESGIDTFKDSETRYAKGFKEAFTSILEPAKRLESIEKDQIKEAYIAACLVDKVQAENLAEQYYNETFKLL